MKVRLLVPISGSRDGVDWPGVSETIDLPEGEASSMIDAGLAEKASAKASAEVEVAATAAGLAYVHIPVRGSPTPEQVEAEQQLFETEKGPVLAFCRSGTRSIITWSLGQVLAGDLSRSELVALGESAGYDLSNVLPR